MKKIVQVWNKENTSFEKMRKHLEKHCVNNNKDKDNSPNVK